MPLPKDWDPTPTINDTFDLADDDPNRCPDTDGTNLCHRPNGHDAEGRGHFDKHTRTVWWPSLITKKRKP